MSLRGKQYKFNKGAQPVCVYVVAHVIDGVVRAPIKVGVSNSPVSRLQTLQIGCPEQLVVAGTFTTPDREWALYLEKSFHETYQAQAIRGEWSDVSPTVAIGFLGYMTHALISFSRDLGPADPEYRDLLMRSGVEVCPIECACFDMLSEGSS